MMRCIQGWHLNRCNWLWLGGTVGVFGLLYYALSTTLLQQEISGQPQLRVLTYNIAGSHADRKQIANLLYQHAPDILLLQEVPRQRLVDWLGDRLQLPYRHFVPYSGRPVGGIAILSRWPLGPAQTMSFTRSQQGKVALAAQIHTPAGPVWACSVHLDAPRTHDFGRSVLQQGAFALGEFFATPIRYHQVRELQSWLATLSSHAWIVAGDFNSMPFSTTDRYISRYFHDVLLQRPWRYFTGTFWDLPQVPIRPRLDYVYHSPGIRVVDAQVIQRKISDHFPVLAILTPTPVAAAASDSDLSLTQAAAAMSHPPVAPATTADSAWSQRL